MGLPPRFQGGGVSEELFLSCVLCLHDIFLAFAVAAKQSWLMSFQSQSGQGTRKQRIPEITGVRAF